jgi:hypothetical protein
MLLNELRDVHAAFPGGPSQLEDEAGGSRFAFEFSDSHFSLEFLSHITAESSLDKQACRLLFAQVFYLTDQFYAIKHLLIEKYLPIVVIWEPFVYTCLFLVPNTEQAMSFLKSMGW